MTKDRNKTEVTAEARVKEEQCILRHWWICHLETSELEQQFQIYKGRVVLRGDIVKNDSGSYAVFHVNKDHQHVKWQPQNSGRHIVLHPGSKWKMHHHWYKFQGQNVQIFGYVYQSRNGPNHGPVRKTQSFFLNEICTVILWQDCYGKGNLRESCSSTVGRSIPIVNANSWMTSNWLERNKTWIRCGKYSIKKLIDLGEPTSFLDIMYTWDVPKDNVEEAKILLTITDPVRIANFSRSNWKTTMLGKSSYFFVVSWYGRSCQEMCGTIWWVGKQDDSRTLQSINTMYWRPPFSRRNEICWRIVKSIISNYSEMFVVDTYWRPDILCSVNKFARSITKWTKSCDKR